VLVLKHMHALLYSLHGLSLHLPAKASSQFRYQ